MLKPVDLYLLAYLVVSPADQTQQATASAIGIAQSNVHRGLRQLTHSSLLADRRPLLRPFRDLLLHAVRHIYPAMLGAPARGVPTAHTAPMLAGLVSVHANIVWPHDTGDAVGTSLQPLHPSAPSAALLNPDFYELLALVDVFRCGRVRERTEATHRLDALLDRISQRRNDLSR